FTYDVLSFEDMIRLMVLEPGRKKGKMKCTLITTRLVDAPNYEAISYVWGSSVKLGVIWCNGKKLEVTMNLYYALQTFRRRFRQRVLWADAICINQQDTTERSSQVRLMCSIFQRASGVLAWLGPKDKR
ncbi:heterokaryon incompatibility protein-domain-containing protein, partial [Hyaloscypha sp. PMI_1271]